MVFIHGNNCHGEQYYQLPSHRHQLYSGHIAFMYLMMSLISSKLQMKRLQNSLDNDDGDDNITKDHHEHCQSKMCTTS